MTRKWHRGLLIAALLASPAIAQTPAPSPGSLDSMGDNQLMNELADRGLDSLLDRYFEVHHTPEAERQAIKSTEALRDLNDPKLTNSERQQRVRQVVDGINTLLPNLRDPIRLAK
ncbi:MAG TPA: hypothetical protein VN541_24745, partial [Tepidisphaeraceae bacterium]|nr:hypothetical protein [Tepidisphaeraceae bacterium]